MGQAFLSGSAGEGPGIVTTVAAVAGVLSLAWAEGAVKKEKKKKERKKEKRSSSSS